MFKSEWVKIHNSLIENFNLLQKPEANIREGDARELFDTNGCKVKVKSAYRSVHYIVKTEPTKRTIIAEIQVRTLLEEAWGEVDHRIRYPNQNDNTILNQYLQIFNRLAGGADEMGDYVLILSAAIASNQDAIIERDRQIKDLKAKINAASASDNEKQSMKDILEKVSDTHLDFFPDFEKYPAIMKALNSSSEYNEVLNHIRNFSSHRKGK